MTTVAVASKAHASGGGSGGVHRFVITEGQQVLPVSSPPPPPPLLSPFHQATAAALTSATTPTMSSHGGSYKQGSINSAGSAGGVFGAKGASLLLRAPTNSGGGAAGPGPLAVPREILQDIAAYLVRCSELLSACRSGCKGAQLGGGSMLSDLACGATPHADPLCDDGGDDGGASCTTSSSKNVYIATPRSSMVSSTAGSPRLSSPSSVIGFGSRRGLAGALYPPVLIQPQGEGGPHDDDDVASLGDFSGFNGNNVSGDHIPSPTHRKPSPSPLHKLQGDTTFAAAGKQPHTTSPHHGGHPPQHHLAVSLERIQQYVLAAQALLTEELFFLNDGGVSPSVSAFLPPPAPQTKRTSVTFTNAANSSLHSIGHAAVVAAAMAPAHSGAHGGGPPTSPRARAAYEAAIAVLSGQAAMGGRQSPGGGGRRSPSTANSLRSRIEPDNALFPFLSITHQPSSMAESSRSEAPQSMAQSFNQVTTKTLIKSIDECTGNKTVNQYLILDDIGEGACGKVKLAYSLERNITVAIKIVRRALGGKNGQQQRSLGRTTGLREEALRREVQLMKRLRHPNLVSLFEVIDDPNANKMYLVMKFADSGSVGSIRRDDYACLASHALTPATTQPPLKQPQVTADGTPPATSAPQPAFQQASLFALIDMTLQVARGLQYLHNRDIFHRDIKPENILHTSEGQYMISDFGISVGYNNNSNHSRQQKRPKGPGTLLSSFLGGAYDGDDDGGQQQQLLIGLGTPLFMAPELQQYHQPRQVREQPGIVVSTASSENQSNDLVSSKRSLERGKDIDDGDEGSASDDDDGNEAERNKLLLAADMWALGVTIMSLGLGRWPFVHPDKLQASPQEEVDAAVKRFQSYATSSSPGSSPCVSESCASARADWARTISTTISLEPGYRPNAAALRKSSKHLVGKALCTACRTTSAAEVQQQSIIGLASSAGRHSNSLHKSQLSIKGMAASKSNHSRDLLLSSFIGINAGESARFVVANGFQHSQQMVAHANASFGQLSSLHCEPGKTCSDGFRFRPSALGGKANDEDDDIKSATTDSDGCPGTFSRAVLANHNHD